MLCCVVLCFVAVFIFLSVSSASSSWFFLLPSNTQKELKTTIEPLPAANVKRIFQ